MKLNQFVKKTLLACSKFSWIKKIERVQIKGRVRLRLFIDKNFIDVYYNEIKKSVSYAYIEKEKRIFGANNMHIGWHIHPYKNADIHKKSKAVSIDRFLSVLEKHLYKENKI